MLPERRTNIPLPAWDKLVHGLFSQIVIHTEKGIQGLEEENVVARQPIVFDELAIDHAADAPALESLYVAEPHGARDAGVMHAVVEGREQLTQAPVDIIQVLNTGVYVACFMACDCANHLAVYRKGLFNKYREEKVQPHQQPR